MKFSDLAKYKTDTGLVVSARYDAWMATNSNPHYNERALNFAAWALEAQSRPRDRKGTISSSSLGSCKRRQQFTYLGMPEISPSPKLAAVFQTGTFMHIRWQMAGLTEGFLDDVEVPVRANQYRLHGTMDGLLEDGSVLELKSANSNSFRRVLSFGPLAGHEFQLGTYLLTTGREKGVFVYEDKDTQEYTEIVRTRDQLPLAEIAVNSAQLWSEIEEENLYEPLDDCMAKTGYRYNGCPFKDNCLKIRGWTEAEDIADQSRSSA